MDLLTQPFLTLQLTKPTILSSHFIIREIKQQAPCVLSFICTVKGLAQLQVQ